MKRKNIFITILVLLELFLGVGGIALLLIKTWDYIFVSGFMIILSIVILIPVVVLYNKMISARNKIKESLALIDIQLKLRFDLIPNLVKVIKKHASHEKELFADIVSLRNQAVKSSNEKEKLELANKLVPQMKNVIAVAENYPELMSSTLFKNLMEQLVDVEDRLVSARRIYDSNVNLYNSLIQVFPNNAIAYMFEFNSEELFKIDAGEAIVVSVKEELKW